MSSIPDEIYKKILVRLPVKPISICKCVCKTWYTLLSTPDFVKLHLHLTIQRNNPNLMLRSYETTSPSSLLHSISYDTILSSVNEIEHDCEIDYPFKSLHYDMGLLGSCNGLVCMWFSDTDETEFFCVWNPATKIYKKLPKSPGAYGVCGFGYDHNTDDYKLINVVDTSCLVEVYTLRSNSWRNTQTIPFRIPMRDIGVLVNGFYHWLGETRAEPFSKVIVSLDISSERFEEIQLPKETGGKTLFFMSVGVLQECLCVIGYFPYEFHVWTMQDYGVCESWTRRFVVASESFMDSIYAKLMWSFENGKIVFTMAGAVVLYDPKDESLRVRYIDGLDNLIEDEVSYFESLVPLDSPTCAKMSSIPDEICHDILLRLPVKSIFTCKCVCKTWYALLSTPDFVKMHLHLTIQRNNPNLMLRSDETTSPSSLLHSISYNTILSSLNEIEHDCEMDYPFKSLHYDMCLLGSCNGLVCLWFADTNKTEFFCVWNPATKIYKKLPKSPSAYGVCGFGYDHNTDDYKLINVVDTSCLVEVYTLRSNCWRTTQTIPFRIPMRDIGVLVNGFYHWLGETRAELFSKVIVSLDISSERFEEIQLPKETGGKTLFFMSVGVLQECLCVIGYFPYEFHVWTMQDYGVRESWTRRFVIASESFMDSIYAKLMWSFENGKIVFTMAGSLVLYDPKDESLRVRYIDGLDNLIEDEMSYVESLVPLDSSTYVGQMNE
ncbi:uncharacterized protein LOC113308688 [Papaver somniferum]|uniref:uncharacterized protein LOC113308688 n=1 Tax=Papaver somniferum TaxID=3469 RepID=UPI000E6F582E|nr:uncharacterized protein LOC113308688 [Papaver somniferum]